MRLVLQHADSLGRQGVGDGPVQMAIAAKAQGVADGEIVIAQHREDAQRRTQLAHDLGHGVDVLEALVDEIAGQGDEVGILMMGQVDRFLQIVGRDVLAAMKVGHLHDAQAGKRGRQPGDGDIVLIHFQPGRLDVAGIGQLGPAAAHQPGQPFAAVPVRLVPHPVTIIWCPGCWISQALRDVSATARVCCIIA